MKQIILMAISIVTLCVQSIYSQSKTEELSETFEKMIPDLMEQHHIVGLNMAIIEKGNIAFKESFGYANKEEKIKMDLNKGFNIGSISKTFTAWAVMKLVEQGKITLDAPVWDYVKKWHVKPSQFNADKITVRKLLQHEAGLSLHGYDGYLPGADLPTLEESLSGNNVKKQVVELIMEPGTKWQYSGGGYTILQLMIEEVSGMSFEVFMKKEIFTPLKMKHTSFTINKKIQKNSATGYDKNGASLPLYRFTAKAAAGLHTTLEDMLKFIYAHWSDNPVLSKESIAIMTKGSDLSKGDYGLGYMIMGRFGFEIVGHGGSNDGWEAGFMCNIESKSAFIILTNGSDGEKLMFPSLKTWANWKNNLKK
ncbi:MAG: beta-lactamase family protein [Chitinophagales bacterium]|nr:beta-lactamase family protein [Chitinophagales bacterium]